MATDLQVIAESLGSKLRRAVAIDDPHMRLQAYTSHFGDVDSVRTASIMHREAPAEATRWVLSLDIAEAQGPMRVPANRKLEMDARVCVPVRAQDTLLGYIWVIDSDSSLTDEELSLAEAAAGEAGIVMYREKLLSELQRGQERELLRDLLSEEPEIRRHAAQELVDADLFASSVSVATFVTRPVLDDDEEPDDKLRLALGVALDRFGLRVLPRHRLYLVRPKHGLFVIATNDPALSRGGLLDLGAELHKQTELAVSGKKSLVGVGDVQQRLEDAVLSYRQAQKSVRVARIVPSFGNVVAWSQLGIYQMLSEFPAERLTSDVLHPGLRKLFERRDAGSWVTTLECYLDCACEARAAADELGLHRASLYYRLQKIEEVAGVSLRNGEDRLALHLGLKLARLAGMSAGAKADSIGAH